MMEHLQWGYVIVGAVVGLIVGMTGVGGGSLMTPILIFGFGIKPHLAVGTDLLFAAGTKMGGTFSLMRQGLVPWRVVLTLCIGSLPACGLTLYLLHQLGPATDQVQRVMTTALGIALLLTALATLYKAFRKPMLTKQPLALSETDDPTYPKHWALPIAFGALIGTLVTLSSVGAGAVGVTVLMLLYPRLSLAQIVAADIAYAVPLTLLAGLGHAGLGSVDWGMLAWLLAGSLPGIWVGTRWVKKTPERLIRAMLSVLLAWAGLKLLAI